MFCCGCLNTETKLRTLNENVARDIREFLGLKQLQVQDRYLYEYICWTCYVVLMKSIKFKKQCLEARNLVMSMVDISRKSLNTLHMLNFKPNLTQGKVVLINVETALKTNEDSFYPPIQEIKSEVPGEGTSGDESETSLVVKMNFTEDNVLNNENVVKSCKEFIVYDEIAPETVLFPTDNELNDEIVIKEEFSNSTLEESVDITDIEHGTPSDLDTTMRKTLEREVRIVLNRIDMGAPQRKLTSNEIPQITKLINLEDTIDGNSIDNAVLKNLSIANDKPLDVGVSNVDISKSKQIVKSTVNYYEVNKISPKINIATKHKSQDIDVQDHKTFTSKVCYSNAGNDILKQYLLTGVDAVALSTSLNRNDDEKKTNICYKNGSEKEFTCHTYQNKYGIGDILNTHIPKHICDVCDYRCSSKCDLNTHIKYKHTKKNFSCHVCDYKCTEINTLNIHLRKHTGEKSYICDLCDNRFSRKDRLRSHIMYKHTMEKKFSCHMCQYTCATKAYLNVHIRKHTGEKPYACDLCDSKFSKKGGLKRHIMLKHIKEKNFSCHFCDYKCVTISYLNIHLRKHTGEKPYTCDFCDNRFSLQSRLTSHIMYKHTKEKKFSCHMCQYKCVTKGGLNAHFRKHNGEKPYTCNFCDIRFSDHSALKRHIMRIHTKEKNFSCHMCQYKCVTNSQLNSHMRKHTGEKPYTCDLCDKRFSQPAQLKRHIMYQHTKEKNFSCHMCQYKCFTKSNLNVHLQKHTGEKPYVCHLCDLKFSARSHLSSHIKFKHTKE